MGQILRGTEMAMVRDTRHMWCLERNGATIWDFHTAVLVLNSKWLTKPWKQRLQSNQFLISLLEMLKIWGVVVECYCFKLLQNFACHLGENLFMQTTASQCMNSSLLLSDSLSVFLFLSMIYWSVCMSGPMEMKGPHRWNTMTIVAGMSVM